MADTFTLTSLSPCAGHLPLKIGKISATEHDPLAITSVSPFQGCHAEVSASLEAQLGIALPGTGQSAQTADVRVIWVGHGDFFVLGAALDDVHGAALTDQSDAWAVACVDGPGVRDMLGRLVPIDLRNSAFPEGATARTLIAHMNGVILRSGRDA